MDLEKFNIPRYLATLPLFMDMSPEELERLSQGCSLTRLERGKSVFRMGEPCQEFYLVVTGQVKLFVLSPTGAEKVIELCGPGRAFGDAVMFLEMPYIVNSQTLSDTLLLRVDKSAVMREIQSDWRFSVRMLGGLSRRLHGLIKDVEAYSLHSGMQRVIGYLLSNLQPEGDEGEPVAASATLLLPVSKASIASRLSLTPEYFSRVLHELETAGLIRVNKREIHIFDTAKLANHQPR